MNALAKRRVRVVRPIEDFREAAVRDARALGVRAAARKHGIPRKTLGRWRREDDLRLALPTAEEVRLLKRDDLGPKDLAAVARIAARSNGYLIANRLDEDDLPASARP